MENDSEIDANVAFGQAFGATMLLTFLLKSLVHKKVFSEQEVTHLIHHTLLAEEVNGKQIVPEAARVRTQGML